MGRIVEYMHRAECCSEDCPPVGPPRPGVQQALSPDKPPSCLEARLAGRLNASPFLRKMTSYTREEVFMEGPIDPNMGPSLADVRLCTFESTTAGFSSFPVRKLLP